MPQPAEHEQPTPGDRQEGRGEGGSVRKEPPPSTVPDEEFEKLAQYSFEKHKELMRRLA